MHVITVRNVPDEVYGALAELAKRNRRSLQQQALIMLESARSLATESPIVQAARIRARLAGRQLGDSVQELRAERRR